MDFNQLTIKAQEVMQQAVRIAEANNQQAVETGHLLKALFEKADSITSFVFKKLDVNENAVKTVLDKIIASYPKVSGGEPYLSSNANKVIREAENLLKSFGDQYVSVEHILIGIFKCGDQISQLLKDNGVTEKNLIAAIQELRKLC